MFHMLTESTYTIYECSCQVMDYLSSPEDNFDDDTFWENFQQALDGHRRGFDQGWCWLIHIVYGIVNCNHNNNVAIV